MVLYNIMPRADGPGWKIEANGRVTGTFKTSSEAEQEAWDRAGPGDIVVPAGEDGRFEDWSVL